jgi:hypothetical protein
MKNNMHEVHETKKNTGDVVQPQAVRGFYSETDVIVLIEALLQTGGLTRDKNGRVSEHSKILAPKRTILENGIVQSEIDDLVLEISSMQSGQQVLIPVIIPSQVHWVTLQIKSYKDSTLHLRVYDSKGSRYIKEMNKLSNLLKAQFSVKTITVNEVTTPTIQHSDVYCGGYTARLISNLVLSSQSVYTHTSIWNCGVLKDQSLRAEDLSIVNAAKPFNYEKFGKPDELSVAECTRNAQEGSQVRRIVLEGKKAQILQEINTLTQEQIAALKITLESIRLELQKPLLGRADPVKHFLVILRTYRLDHTILKKFIFKLDECGELIRTDSKGVIVLPDQDGDSNIKDDLEIEQIAAMLEFTLGVVSQYKSEKGANIKLDIDNHKKQKDITDIKNQEKGQNFHAKNDAMDKIVDLIKENNLPSKKFDEVFESLVAGARDEEPSIKISALSGMRHLIENDKLCPGKIGRILDLSIVIVVDTHEVVKRTALLVIIELIQKNKLFIGYVANVLSVLIENVESASDDMGGKLLFGINKLIEKGKLPIAKIEEVLNLFFRLGKSESVLIKKEVLFGVSELIKKDQLPVAKIEESLNLFMEGTKDKDACVQKEGFFGMGRLIERDILPMSKIEQVMRLLIKGIGYLDDSVKKESMLGIIKLIDKNQLPEDKVEALLDLLEKLANIENSNLLRHNAVVAIGKLAEKGVVPEHRIEGVLSLLISKKEGGILFFHGISDTERAEIITITDGAIITRIKTAYPSITSLVEQAESRDNSIRATTIQQLALLAKKGKIPAEEIDKVLTLLITKAKDGHDDVKGVYWKKHHNCGFGF